MIGRKTGIILLLLLALVLTLLPPPSPVMAAGGQSWYLTDYTTGLSGADYRMIRGSGNGGTDTLFLAKSTSKVWVAAVSSASDESSNISCRMSGTWAVTLYADGEGNSDSSLTVDIGTLSSDGTTFTSKGVSAEQTVPKAGGTLNFNVTTTAHTLSPGEYLAIRVNCTSVSKGFDLDVLGATDSPCFVTSPATAVDDYPGTVIISFTISDYGSDGVNFGGLMSGSTDQPADQTAGTGAVTLTVGSDTNVPINVQLKGEDFSGAGTIAVGNIKYNDSDTVVGASTLTATYVTWYPVSAYTSDTVQCYFWITIPAGQAGGDYTSTFYFQAVPQ